MPLPGAVLVGHAYLALVSLWAIAFGLSVSTRFGAARASTIVAVAVTLPGSVALLGVTNYLGPWTEVHWDIPATGPYWPATAVAMGLGPQRLVFLVVLPLLATFGALWYLAATAVGPLLPPSEDRGRGARLWIPLAGVLLAIGVLLGRLLLEDRAARDFAIVGMGAALAVVVIGSLTIAAEPLRAPSGRGLLGPGLGRASLLLALSGAATIAALAALLHAVGVSPWWPEASIPGVATLVAWVICFAATGHALRSALPSVAVARIVLGALAVGLGVALPQTSIAEAAPWTPWFVLRNLHRTEWTAAAIPAGVSALALLVSGSLAVVRGRRR